MRTLLVKYGLLHAETERAIIQLKHQQHAFLAFLFSYGQLAFEVAHFRIEKILLRIPGFCKRCILLS